MATWPNIQNPSGLAEKPTKGQIRSDFEAGYVYSRAKWTRARKRFDLTWDSMTNSDKNTLETFFNNNLGSTFTWEHPVSGTTYTVRFSDDSIDFDYVPHMYWQASVSLEEQ